MVVALVLGGAACGVSGDGGSPFQATEGPGSATHGGSDTSAVDTGTLDTGGTISETSGGSQTDGATTVTSTTDSGGSDGTTDATGSTGTGTGGADCRDPDPTDGAACEAPWDLLSCDADSDDPFHALGLGCGGDPDHVIPIQNTVFESPDPAAWTVARQFGTYVDPVTQVPAWSPREGQKFLMLSTGLLPEPDADGIVSGPPGIFEPGKNTDNPNDVPLPAPISPVDGSNGGMGGTPFACCDGVNDCSDSLADQWEQGTPFQGDGAIDLVWFQFEVEVPPGTHGFSFDFAFFSAEFPEYVGHIFNDVFVVWSESQTYTGNLCFVDDQPCSVTALWPVAYQQLAPELEGTGLEAGQADGGAGLIDVEGGSTGWYEVSGSAAPGETLRLTFALFDLGNSGFDSTVLLDNWRWDCEGCDLGSEVEPCGVGPT